MRVFVNGSTLAALKGYWPILSESKRVCIDGAISTVSRTVIALGCTVGEEELR